MKPSLTFLLTLLCLVGSLHLLQAQEAPRRMVRAILQSEQPLTQPQADSLQQTLKGWEGILFVQVSAPRGEIAVAYDPGLFRADTIVARLGEQGYPARVAYYPPEEQQPKN
ncbi:MAG: hypothetical protein OHK0039_15510 [Bacteroidia bacterium]